MHAQENGDLLNKTEAIVWWAARDAGVAFQFWVKVDTDTLLHPHNLAGYLVQLSAASRVYMGMNCPLKHCWLARESGVPYMQGAHQEQGQHPWCISKFKQSQRP